MAARASIPDDVRRLIAAALPSVPHLEAALLFHAAPDIERSPGDVARVLYVDERVAAQLLMHLCEHGFVQPRDDDPPRYRYAPRDEALAQATDRLAAFYATNLIDVTKFIHDSTQKSAHRFAEAFKLRKDR